MPRQRQQSESSSPHRPRRAALRTVSKHATLAQRRTHFKRVVQHHISQRRANSETPRELWQIDQSALPDDGQVSLDPDDVKDCLQNTEAAPHYLCSVLQQLRKVTNEASSDEENNEFDPTASADAGAEASSTSREMKSSTEGEKSEENQSETIDLTNRATLENLAQVLADKNFIDQESYEIRIFTACSLAEILRISAPNPPLSESKLKAVCNLFIDELSVIAFADDHLKSYRFALLEQLAAVKTFAIFSGEEHVIADIFACFYAAVRPFQPEKYKEHLGFILDTLLSEVQSIGQPLLDALLAPLSKPSNKSSSSEVTEINLKSFAGYSASAIELAEYVVVTSKNLLQVPICNFFNSALHKLSKGRVLNVGQKGGPGRRRGQRAKDLENGDNDPDYEIVDSELEDDIENLVVSVYRIAPSILIYVIPSLEDRLRAKDPIVRRNIAHLLGKLFISSAEATSIYSSVFTEFLHRSRDIDPNLRAEVCQSLGPLIASTPSQRDTLNKTLSDRVLDQSEIVREAVARSAGETQSFASRELISNLATRLRDRKPSVREETFLQLAGLYKSQLKKISAPSSEPAPMQSFPSTAGDMEEASEKEIEAGGQVSFSKTRPERSKAIIPEWMDELPNLLLNCHQALQPVAELNFLGNMDRFMFEQMLSWDCDSEEGCDTRVRRFASFLGNLNGHVLVYFSSLVHRRAQLTGTLLKICDIRLQQGTSHGPKRNPANGNDKMDVDEATPVREVKKTFAKKAISPPDTFQVEVEKKLDEKLTADLLKLSNTLSALIGRRKVKGEDTKDLCWKMCNFADRKFFEQIKIILDPTSSSAEALNATQDATARLSSKSTMGEFVGNIVLPASRFLMFSTRHLQSAYRHISKFCKIVSDEHELGMIDMDFFKNTDFTFIHENDVLFGLLRFIELASLHFSDAFQHLQSQAFDIVQQATDKTLPVQQVLLNSCKTIARVDWGNVDEAIRDPLIEQLRNLMTAPVFIDAQVSSAMAKWATRAHIQLCKELDPSDEVWKETRTLLQTRLSARMTDATLLVTLYSTLAQLAKHSPAVFKSLAVGAFDHAYFLISGSCNEGLTSKLNLKSSTDSDDEEEKESHYRMFWKSSFTPVSGACRLVCEAGIISNLYVACLAELVGRGIKILIHCVQALDFDDDDFERIVIKLNYVSESQKGDVFALRVPFVDENGEEVEEDDDRYQHPAVVASWNVIRLSCSSAILYLARSRQFCRRLSPTHLNWALLCCQDQNSDVRIQFARNLQRAVVRRGLPFRWIAALSLMAVDPDKDNVMEARDILTSALRRRRNNIRLKLQNSTLASLRPHLPEVTVPVLIWLIAKHPDPDDDESFYPHAERMMDFLLDRLLDSNEYAAVINEYLDALAVAKDRTEKDEGVGPSTERTHKLTRMCSLLLKKKQSGRKWNLIEHPGTVALPGDLFRKCSTVAESSNAGPIPTFLDAAKKYDEDLAPAQPEAEPIAEAHEKRVAIEGGEYGEEEAAAPPEKEDSATNSANVPHLTIETPTTVRKLKRSRSTRSTRSTHSTTRSEHTEENADEPKAEIPTPDSARKSVSSKSSARSSGKRKRRSTSDSPTGKPPRRRRSSRNSNAKKQT